MMVFGRSFRSLGRLTHTTRNLHSTVDNLPNPDLNLLLGPQNRLKVVDNLVKRLQMNKAKAVKMMDELIKAKEATVKSPTEENRKTLITLAAKFPNLTHPSVMDMKDPTAIYTSEEWRPKEELRQGQFVRPFEEVAKSLGYPIRTQNTGQTSTEKSFYLYNQIAELEQALVRYTIDHLVKRHNFKLMSVPDLLDPSVIRSCGMDVDSDRHQIFKLDLRHCGQVALSGTAEMAFGGFFANKRLDFGRLGQGQSSTNSGSFFDSIRKYCAVSRCYRHESAKGQKERGIYRVHHFTKVEMFSVMPGNPDLSNLALEQFLEIQKQLFEGLGLHFKVLDMPPYELGNPAYRKYDVEALYPGRKNNKKDAKAAKKDAKAAKKDANEKVDGDFYGEISSCSNCTDYQSRRLNIRDENGKFAHTINGTACAVPRMIMAIVEQNQVQAAVVIPEKLRRYMRGKTRLEAVPKKLRCNTTYFRSPKGIKAKHWLEQEKNIGLSS